MAMTRWDPFQQMTTLSDAVSQLMREAVLRPTFHLGGDVPMNVLQKPEQFVIEVALPGVKPEDIDITCEQTTLTIKAHREAPFAQWAGDSGTKSDQVSFLLTEFVGGDFVRSVTLSKAINSDRLEASFERGVLTIVVPIAQEAQPKRIAITEGGARQLVGANSQH
jgi:HSP20 family protein